MSANKKVYSYNPNSLLLVGETYARPCPEEEGVYHFPAHTTEEIPPPEKDGKLIVFDIINKAWRYIDKPIPPVVKKTPIDLRIIRNNLLSKSDIYMLMDNYSLLSDEDKKAWIVYRKYLRDLPTKSEFETPEKWLTKETV